jgi:hypothetical protein
MPQSRLLAITESLYQRSVHVLVPLPIRNGLCAGSAQRLDDVGNVWSFHGLCPPFIVRCLLRCDDAVFSEAKETVPQVLHKAAPLKAANVTHPHATGAAIVFAVQVTTVGNSARFGDCAWVAAQQVNQQPSLSVIELHFILLPANQAGFRLTQEQHSKWTNTCQVNNHLYKYQLELVDGRFNPNLPAMPLPAELFDLTEATQ